MLRGQKCLELWVKDNIVLRLMSAVVIAQASENAKQRDGFGATWAQDYYLPAKADG